MILMTLHVMLLSTAFNGHYFYFKMVSFSLYFAYLLPLWYGLLWVIAWVNGVALYFYDFFPSLG